MRTPPRRSGRALARRVGAIWLATLSSAAGLADSADATRAPQTAERALVERFAPVLKLALQEHECSGDGDPYDPAPVETVLGSPRVPLRQLTPRRPVVAEAPTASDLFEGDASLFLDFPGNPRLPGCRYERDYRRFLAGRGPVAYARVAREPGQTGLAVQYWLFYYFNAGDNPHEGDWEMVQLSFAAGTPEDALAEGPARIAVTQHAAGERAAWEDEKLEKEAGKPVIYVAKGSHANYYSQRLFLGRGEAGAGFGCDDTSPPVRSVTPALALVPARVAGPEDPFAWVTFRGHWGERQPSFYDSATGPVRKQAWEIPFSWEEGLRDASVVVPGGGALGPRATDAFCTSVTVVARALNLHSTWPYPTMAAGALLMLGVTLLVVRTRWWPADPRPLRQRRAAGQILRVAGKLYRRHVLVFLSLGGVFVPVMLAAAGLQAVVFRLPPFQPLLDLLPDDRVVGGLVAFLLGSLASIVAFAATVAAVAVALLDVDEGRRPSALRAYRTLASRIRPLAIADLLAVGGTLLLFVSIIGIPWALRQIVRWAFIQQAVIIDGLRARQALRASSQVVAGNWWRTLGIWVGVGLFALVLGPVVGIVLLVFVPGSLAFVDLTSSAVYVAVVPYIALVLTLLYFDLRASATTALEARP